MPGGALKDDGAWVRSSKKKRYFLPERVLIKVFQGIFFRALRTAQRQGKITFAGDLNALIAESLKKRWVIHTEAPFGSPLLLLKYLARYTRKVACANSRLVSLKDGVLTFSWKDYAHGALQKLCALSAVEFIRRYLLHIPPPGFMRIRYYGFMTGKNRKARMLALREAILGLLPELPMPKSDGSFVPGRCPCCGCIALKVIATLLPGILLLKDSS